MKKQIAIALTFALVMASTLITTCNSSYDDFISIAQQTITTPISEPTPTNTLEIASETTPEATPAPEATPTPPSEPVIIDLSEYEGDIDDEKLAGIVSYGMIPQNVTHLSLAGNQISDLSPLSELIELRSLFLVDNQIIDIYQLSGLTNLEGLYLHNNSVSYSQLNALQVVLPNCLILW